MAKNAYDQIYFLLGVLSQYIAVACWSARCPGGGRRRLSECPNGREDRQFCMLAVDLPRIPTQPTLIAGAPLRTPYQLHALVSRVFFFVFYYCPSTILHYGFSSGSMVRDGSVNGLWLFSRRPYLGLALKLPDAFNVNGHIGITRGLPSIGSYNWRGRREIVHRKAKIASVHQL